MKKLLSKFTFWFMLAIIIFIPFQSMMGEILSFKTSLSVGAIFWLEHWYEPAAVLLVILQFISQKTGPDICRDRLWNIITTLIALGVASILVISPTRSLGLEGFRFTLFPILFLILALLAGLKDQEKRAITNTYLSMALLIAVWAILERFLPAGYWQEWGAVAPATQFGYGFFRVTDTLQSVSFLNGPNQLATYLLPAVFIPVFNRRNYPLSAIHHLLITAAIILTFSRSAILGLAVGLMVIAFIKVKNKWAVAATALLVLIIFTGLWRYSALTNNRAVMDLFTHGDSQVGHQSALQQSLLEIRDRFYKPITLLFGSGLGTAGPIALKYGGIISESWYFQVLFELGLLGLLGWLALIYYLIKKSWQDNFGLAIGLIAVSFAALFLHTWADNPAIASTLFIILGSTYCNVNDRNYKKVKPNKESGIGNKVFVTP